MSGMVIEENILTLSSIVAISILSAAVIAGIVNYDSSLSMKVRDSCLLLLTDIDVISHSIDDNQVKIMLINSGTQVIKLTELDKAIILFGKVGKVLQIDNWNYSLIDRDLDKQWDPGEILEIKILDFNDSERGFYTFKLILQSTEVKYSFRVR